MFMLRIRFLLEVRICIRSISTRMRSPDSRPPPARPVCVCNQLQLRVWTIINILNKSLSLHIHIVYMFLVVLQLTPNHRGGQIEPCDEIFLQHEQGKEKKQKRPGREPSVSGSIPRSANGLQMLWSKGYKGIVVQQ